jgi:hypothetical protein
MKNTKWRDIILSILIGIAFGVVLISVGFKFIAENIRASILTAIILIFITGVLVIIVYRNRKKAISLLTGVNENDLDSLQENIDSLNKAIKDKRTDKVQISISNLSRIVLAKYSEVAFRTWAFRMFFSLLAVFGGVITAGLLLKQNQLIEEERNLLSAQNLLIEKESNYLVEINKPRLGIKNSGVSFQRKGDTYEVESLVRIVNYGGREAQNVRTTSVIYEVNEGGCKILRPTEHLNSNNPIVPEQEINYVHFFNTTKFESKIYLRIELVYFDGLSKEDLKIILNYRYPTIKQIDSSVKKELGLFGAEKVEIIDIENCK